jgi:hypothetical protein
MFLGKEVRVLLKGQAKESFLELKKSTDKEAQSLVRSIQRKIDVLKDNPQYGDPIAKRLIPEKFKLMGIKNLYRAELSNYWRMLYTIEGTRVEIFLFVLSIVDHKQYNKLFGYKKH